MSASPARGSSSRSTRIALVALAALLSLVLAACGGGDKESKEKKAESQPIEGGQTLAALWPLTGQPVNGATPNRPVLVTKIDNSSSSRPQVGLKKADLITEELVEGGMTRLAVFHYQRLPSVVGPVRSMRATDIGIVKPALGVLVASGAAPPTIRRLQSNMVTFFGEGGPGYFRDGSRSAPYNLMVRLPRLASAVKKKAIVPASYLPWGKEEDFTGTAAARTVNATFSRSHTTTFTYQGGKYRNQNSYAAQGDQFLADSVLVLRLRVGDAGYRDPAGNPVPETIYAGKGQALLFHGGKVVRGTWSKKSLRSPLKLSTTAGQMKVPAGHTWIELLPKNRFGGRVTFAK